MSTPIDLIAQVSLDASDAAAGFDKIARSAEEMGDAVKASAAKADGAVDRMSSIADSADNLDSKAAQATGSLGALASGFELVGADKYAAGLQSAAMATDFMAGVGEGLNLVMELQAVQMVKAKVATIAQTVATKAAAAASKAWAAAQWLLNAAMSANPIGLVVAGVGLLIAGFVILWKKSDTFRKLVKGIWPALKTGVTTAAATVKTVWAKVSGYLTGPFDAVKKVVADLFGKGGLIPRTVDAAVGLVKKAWAGVKDVLEAPFTAVKEFVQDLFGRNGPIMDAINGLTGLVAKVLDGVIAAVNTVIDTFNKLPGPNIGNVSNPLRSAPSSSGASARGLGAPAAFAGTGGTVINFHITGATDPYTVGGQIQKILVRRGLINGRTRSAGAPVRGWRG
jgi:phage-related protein